ncbi:MAG: glycosyltransferase family 4 protein [Flavobacteriales bacterium]|nr:glycosyltransferase family 4 protein [Flavobacteriales bacterium]
MSNQKVVLVTNIPNQYRIPLFNELHQQLKGSGSELYVVFGAMGYQKRKSIIELSECNFNYEVLQSGLLHKVENKTGFLFYAGLLSVLKKLKASRIIVAGYSLATIKLWSRSFFCKTDYFIWSGSIEREGEQKSFLRSFQRKLLIRRGKAFIAYGSLAKKNFEELGAEASKVIAVGNTVDTNFFEQQVGKIRAELVSQTRKHLTYIGYLTPRKNVQLLLYVIKELLKYRNDFILEVIGDGENKEELEKYVEQNNLGQYVLFHGFLQKEELPKHLAISNCFLFQTDFDIWGLVLNEAMAAGIPCLSSVNAGATEDLIEEGITGFKVNFAESKQLAEKINWILNHPTEMAELGKKASNFIASNYSLPKCAERIISIL